MHNVRWRCVSAQIASSAPFPAMQGHQEEPQLPRAGGGGNAEMNASLASRTAHQGSAVDQAGIGACHHDVPVAHVLGWDCVWRARQGGGWSHCMPPHAWPAPLAICRLQHCCCCSRPSGALPAWTRMQVTGGGGGGVPAATCQQGLHETCLEKTHNPLQHEGWAWCTCPALCDRSCHSEEHHHPASQEASP